MPEALARWMALCDGALAPPISRLVRGGRGVSRPAADLPPVVRPGALVAIQRLAWRAAMELAAGSPS